ncbi:MAG: D-alanyl-D-alanine carboxypeptidase family protein [Pseudomonadota bacterium]|nr:D-alanyl-D-alanine carboxypeptidase family protein [Pseudomonadota bacterium]
MRLRPDILLNSPAIELWPAWLLRARSNADARLLAQSRWVWRRKRDGRYLAAVDGSGQVTPMLAELRQQAGYRDALTWAQQRRFRLAHATHPAVAMPIHGLAERLAGLGLDADTYAERSGLALVAEPDWLAYAGVDRYHRALWLAAPAVRGWQQMQAAALADGLLLEAISGYRSHAYQLGIFERKRARGLGVDEILAVNAAPGFSEHHSGLALDIGTPDQPPAEESFETTVAFAWLTRHAADFGFHMSYPRDNPHGIVYEPWHWRFAG